MKKVFIGVLAALMLFAFVACDSNAPVGQDQLVVKIETSSVPTYLAGQEASLSDYTVIGTRFNGETFTVSSEDLEFTPVELVASTDSDSDGVLDPSNAGTIRYVGGYNYVKSPISVGAIAYAVEDLKVTGPSASDEYYQDVIGSTIDDEVVTADSVFNKDKYSVVATYTVDGEEQEVKLANDEYIVNFSDDALTTTGSGTVATFTLDLNKDGKAEGSVSATASVAIIADRETTWSVGLAEDFEAIIGATADTATVSDVIVATQSWISGKTTDITSGVTISYPEDYTTFTDPAVTLTVTKTGTTETKTISVDPVRNYITAFTGVQYTGGNVAPGEMFDISQLQGTFSWKDQKVGAPEGFTPSYVVSPSNQMPTWVEAGESYAFKVTLSGYDFPAQYVSITAAAE